jgi:ABC-type phosphate/phosphonate transport system ATPase subunit
MCGLDRRGSHEEALVSGAAVVSFQSLAQQFGRFTAVQDLSLDVAAGRVVGLLGRNGAGKPKMIDSPPGVLPNVDTVGSALPGKPAAARLTSTSEVSLPSWRRSATKVASSSRCASEIRCASEMYNTLVEVIFVQVGV